MSGICVIMKDLKALVEGIDGEDYEHFLPLDGRQLIAEEGHKIPKHSTYRWEGNGLKERTNKEGECDYGCDKEERQQQWIEKVHAEPNTLAVRDE